MPGPKFAFYEIVLVSPKISGLLGLPSNAEGAILGRSESAKANWQYAVYFEDLKETIMVDENDLLLTGKQTSRDAYYDGSTAKIAVDPQTGKGTIRKH